MNYHNITKDDMLNGDGVRVVLWVSGCEHHCPNCQNPQTWSEESGIKFDEVAFNELLDELEKDYVTGITFSGGDPMHPQNLSDVGSICRAIRILYPEKTIWLYTGYTFEELMDTHTYLNDERWLILNNIDVLVDGKYVESLRDVNLKWRGSSNQRVIDVKRTLNEGKVTLHCE